MNTNTMQRLPGTPGERLCEAERRAVERFREELCRRRGESVDFEAAYGVWETECAAEWRARRMLIASERQREEILRHKWIESLKAGHDLGREAAMDWVIHHAAAWRRWFDSQDTE